MDMSVPIGAGTDSAPAQKPAAAKRAPPGPNASELDLWLEKVEAMGELKRITAEVDPNLEAATITYLVGLEKSPALLFENIKGHPGHKALYNMIGCNLSRFCVMIGEEPVDHPLKAVQLLQKKFGRKMAPVEVPAERAVPGVALDVLEQQGGRLFAADQIGDGRGFEIRIDLRGDALELSERLDLFEPGIEIARVGATGHAAGLGFLKLPIAAVGADRDAHVHGRLPSCSVADRVRRSGPSWR